MPRRDHPRFEQVVRRAIGRTPWSLRLAITAIAIVALLATSAVLHLVPGMTYSPSLGKRTTPPGPVRAVISPDISVRHLSRICS
jgi:hypothetical protein